jgi:hypothetical protein
MSTVLPLLRRDQREQPRRMALLIALVLFVLLSGIALWFGEDSRDGRDWVPGPRRDVRPEWRHVDPLSWRRRP